MPTDRIHAIDNDGSLTDGLMPIAHFGSAHVAKSGDDSSDIELMEAIEVMVMGSELHQALFGDERASEPDTGPIGSNDSP